MQHESGELDGEVRQTNQTDSSKKRAYLESLAVRLKAYLAGESDDESVFLEFARYFRSRFAAHFRHKGLTEFDALDLAENCTTDFALKADQYQTTESGSFEAWVFTLMHHALADWYRRRVATEPLAEQPASTERKKLQRRRIARITPDRNVIAAVRAALSQLKERDRALIELRDFIEEHSYEEIAALLGRTSNALSTQHHRLLAKLRAMLEQDPRMREWLKRAQQQAEKKEG